MNLKGIVERRDIGSGLFILKTEEGNEYALKGGDKRLYVNQKHVSVEGDVEGQEMGIGMTGHQTLNVTKFRTLKV